MERHRPNEFDTDDYYAQLGVKRDASSQEIKSAYRKLSKKFHPDVNGDPMAAQTFMSINEAYRILIDDEKRSDYDKRGKVATPVRSARTSNVRIHNKFFVNRTELDWASIFKELLEQIGKKSGEKSPHSKGMEAKETKIEMGPKKTAQFEIRQGTRGTYSLQRIGEPLDMSSDERNRHTKIEALGNNWYIGFNEHGHCYPLDGFGHRIGLDAWDKIDTDSAGYFLVCRQRVDVYKGTPIDSP